MTLERVDADEIELGDIVVARVGDATMLHLVKALDHWNRQVEISGTSGSANGWTSLDRVVAICTQIDGKPVPGAPAKVKPARGSRLLGIARRR